MTKVMYVSLLEPGRGVSVNVLRSDDEFIVQVPIGFDDAARRVYSLFVAMAPLMGCADIPGYELTFEVVDASIDKTDVIAHYDGTATRKFLADPEDRARVRNLLLRATELLIDEAQPNQVQMMTHSAHLPPKALVKFGELCALFGSKGFIAGKADSYHGRHIWMMTR
ncbi:hypothetical protein [Sphingomonas sp. VNH70]|uniref:hypothetical protein n=1 Tax=Sphingomonas silueang TaxID=3156617 RepID=UPI0032B4A03C